MQLANYHAHSHFSDGREGPEVYLQNAIQQGLKAYGFSDHAPIPIDNFGSMSIEQLEAYGAEIDRLKADFGDQINIYKSLEVDFIPDVININTKHIQEANLDYTIGAVHFIDYLDNGRPWGFEGSAENFELGLNQVFGGAIKACIARYYGLIREMVQKFTPDIIAHVDRIKKQNKGERYFAESEKWYQAEVIQTLEVIAASKAVMEINTKGYYRGEIPDLYPDAWILEHAKAMDIPVHLSSDAHHPDDITKGFERGIEILKTVGIESTRLFLNGEWVDTSIEALSEQL